MPSPYNDTTGALAVGGRARARSEITRPADVTAYAAGDVVAGAGIVAPIRLTGVGRQSGGAGEIVQLAIATNLATITFGTFRVHFFKESFVLAADNAAFAQLHANRANYLGYTEPPILAATGGGAATKDDDLRIPFECSSTAPDIFAVIEALAAYVPASGQIISLSVGVTRD